MHLIVMMCHLVITQSTQYLKQLAHLIQSTTSSTEVLAAEWSLNRKVFSWCCSESTDEAKAIVGVTFYL